MYIGTKIAEARVALDKAHKAVVDTERARFATRTNAKATSKDAAAADMECAIAHATLGRAIALSTLAHAEALHASPLFKDEDNTRFAVVKGALRKKARQ